MNSGCCNSISNSISLSDSFCLEEIYVRNSTFQSLKSLSIVNNTNLRTIVVDDGNSGTTAAFQTINTVVISGMLLCIILILSS